MNRKFVFKPSKVVWYDELPPQNPVKTPTGRMRMFVGVLKTRPNTWGQVPYIYQHGANGTLHGTRKNYPEIEWEARGTQLWGRYTPK